ncbi:MAG: hypothetical protein MZW92_18630 [Comamonadaceae bacterium]|nr:hypothetical protein [Comamonadaceae bacterium]
MDNAVAPDPATAARAAATRRRSAHAGAPCRHARRCWPGSASPRWWRCWWRWRCGAPRATTRCCSPTCRRRTAAQIIDAAGADERALPLRRRRRRDPGAGRRRCTTLRLKLGRRRACPRARHRPATSCWTSSRFGQTQGQERMNLPARARRRADAHDPGAGVGAGGARAPGAAATRTASSASSRSPRASVVLHAAPGPHARPRADRRHRAPGVVAACPS